jgi:membrane associated rhomboid family serine protease
MGIYDRDYSRDDSYGRAPGFHLGGYRTLTTDLVLLNIAIFVVQMLTRVPPVDAGWFTDTFSLHADLPRQPWLCFELITYGFLHDPYGIMHIVLNMLGLWLFGRIVEQHYGRYEYLAFYLTSIVFAGLAWIAGEWLAGGNLSSASMLGASGGCAAVYVLFALNYPRQTVLLYFAIPAPAWVGAVIFIVFDMFGAMERSGNVAFTAHLGGALFSFLYFRFGWKLSNWLPTSLAMPKLRRRPKLRVHRPLDTDDDDRDSHVDDILRKIKQFGQDSLTKRERRILEQASREYQRRRGGE